MMLLYFKAPTNFTNWIWNTKSMKVRVNTYQATHHNKKPVKHLIPFLFLHTIASFLATLIYVRYTSLL